MVDNKDLIKLLIQNLRKLKSPATTIVEPANIIVQNWLNSVFEKLITSDGKLKIDKNRSLLLAAFYECQGEISSELRKRLIIYPVGLTDIMLHHDIRNAMYLFTKLNGTNIYKIEITNISKNKFPNNMTDLLNTKTNKILHLKEMKCDYIQMKEMNRLL